MFQFSRGLVTLASSNVVKEIETSLFIIRHTTKVGQRISCGLDDFLIRSFSHWTLRLTENVGAID
jgi:hypothetical protein